MTLPRGVREKLLSTRVRTVFAGSAVIDLVDWLQERPRQQTSSS